jgi:hypothetical protein
MTITQHLEVVTNGVRECGDGTSASVDWLREMTDMEHEGDGPEIPLAERTESELMYFALHDLDVAYRRKAIRQLLVNARVEALEQHMARLKAAMGSV